jgi:hypothetical protein
LCLSQEQSEEFQSILQENSKIAAEIAFVCGIQVRIYFSVIPRFFLTSSLF